MNLCGCRNTERLGESRGRVWVVVVVVEQSKMPEQGQHGSLEKGSLGSVGMTVTGSFCGHRPTMCPPLGSFISLTTARCGSAWRSAAICSAESIESSKD